MDEGTRPRAARGLHRGGAAWLVASAALLGGPAPARAAGRVCGPPPLLQVRSQPLSPTPEVRPGPGFALLTGAGSLAEVGCAPHDIARAALTDAVRRLSSSLHVDPQLAVVLTTAPTRCDSIYYIPLANDTRGIGYVHADPRELFDDTPDLELEGIAFLNDWPYWSGRPAELESAFNHEVAHRWGARVRASDEAGQVLSLLGRGGDHWSYFLDSAGSVHEGNVWVAATSGFQSQTPEYPSALSALDLYLMGVATPDEVPPLRLLTNPEAPGVDCVGRSVSASSPPQTCGDTVIRAEMTPVSLDDIIAVEGPRVPAPAREPRDVDVVVLVIESSGSPLTREDCDGLALAIDERLDGFEQATRGRMRLHNVVDASTSCDTLSEAVASRVVPTGGAPGASGCALGGPSSGNPRVGWLLWVAALGTLLYRKAQCNRLPSPCRSP